MGLPRSDPGLNEVHAFLVAANLPFGAGLGFLQGCRSHRGFVTEGEEGGDAVGVPSVQGLEECLVCRRVLHEALAGG